MTAASAASADETPLRKRARVILREWMPAAVVFIEAFDNVTVALFTASPRARPLSVELYYLVQYDSSPLVAAVSACEILLAFVAVAVASRASM